VYQKPIITLGKPSLEKHSSSTEVIIGSLALESEKWIYKRDSAV